MPRERGADRIPGNWRATSYGRTGFILLGIAGALAGGTFVLRWLAPDAFYEVVPAAGLGIVWPLMAVPAALGMFLTAAVGPRLFPRRRPRTVCLWFTLTPYVVWWVSGAGCDRNPYPPRWRESACEFNLEQMSRRLEDLRRQGRLRPLAGVAFLTQPADGNVEGKKESPAFVCLADPERPDAWCRPCTPHCFYRGPDLETARRFVEGTLPPDTVIACDADGPGGDIPWHEDYLIVLQASGRVVWLPRGDPSQVPLVIGPDSPDPRFRHLVR